jgi:hypothetical protein
MREPIDRAIRPLWTLLLQLPTWAAVALVSGTSAWLTASGCWPMRTTCSASSADTARAAGQPSLRSSSEPTIVLSAL